MKVHYTYASLGDEVAQHPIWLLKSFEATLSTKWKEWLEKYWYNKTLTNPEYRFLLEELLDRVSEKSKDGLHHQE